MRTRRSALEKGQGLVEYALILVLVSVVVIVILSVTGQKITEIFCDITLKIGGQAPNIQACAAPRVMITGLSNGATVSGPVLLEVLAYDDKGNTQPNITSVKFYLDGSGTPFHTETGSKYCLAGTNEACSGYSFSPGTHTLRVVITDADSNTGESSVTFTAN